MRNHVIGSSIDGVFMESIDGVLSKDKEYLELSEKVYSVLKDKSTEDAIAFDDDLSKMVGRVMEIAYKRGMHDMFQFHVDMLRGGIKIT